MILLPEPLSSQSRAWVFGIAASVLIATTAASSAAVSWKIATWRADAAHAGELLKLRDATLTLSNEKHALELAIAEANKALAVARAETQAADQLRVMAQRQAAESAAMSKARLEKLGTIAASAKGCADVLQGYWGDRK